MRGSRRWIRGEKWSESNGSRAPRRGLEVAMLLEAVEQSSTLEEAKSRRAKWFLDLPTLILLFLEMRQALSGELKRI